MAFYHFALPIVACVSGVLAPFSIVRSAQDGVLPLHSDAIHQLPNGSVEQITSTLPTGIIVKAEPNAVALPENKDWWDVGVYQPATKDNPAIYHQALVTTSGSLYRMQADIGNTKKLKLLPIHLEKALKQQKPDAIIFDVIEQPPGYQAQFLSKGITYQATFAGDQPIITKANPIIRR